VDSILDRRVAPYKKDYALINPTDLTPRTGSMLTRVPANAAQYAPPPPGQRDDDLSGYHHRQAIGYLGLVLPILLVQVVRLRPNPVTDEWTGTSISAYYWTGAVALFAGVLAALSLFLLTYRGYANAYQKYDRGVAIVAGIAAGLVALFPTAPPTPMTPPWWAGWIGTTHIVATTILFSMFALFSLWLFRITAPGEPMTAEKKWRNAIYLVCGIGIVGSMLWTFLAGRANRSIFWPESSALGFFAWSWLTKGRALRSIRDTTAAVKNKVTS
jgi:hypothetical protein